MCQNAGTRPERVHRALVWIARYRDEVQPECAIAGYDGTLFSTVTGQAFSDNRITQMVRNHVRAAGHGNIGSCHLFRHAMATQMRKTGPTFGSARRCWGTRISRRRRSTRG